MDSLTETILADFHQRLRRIYGSRLVRLILFGSQARGDATNDSDIDVLVVLKGPVNPCAEIARTEHDAADLSLANDVVILCIFVSEEDYNAADTPLVRNATREGVSL